MDAFTAREKARENLEASRRRRQQQDASTLAQSLKKSEYEKAKIDKHVAERELPEALKAIEKAVSLGKTSVSIMYGFSCYAISQAVTKALLELGYVIIPRGEYHPPESGEKESAGGWTNHIEVCWG